MVEEMLPNLNIFLGSTAQMFRRSWGPGLNFSKSRLVNHNVNTYSVLTAEAWNNNHTITTFAYLIGVWKYFLQRQAFIILAVMYSGELNIFWNVRVFVAQQFQLSCQLDYHSIVLAKCSFFCMRISHSRFHGC